MPEKRKFESEVARFEKRLRTTVHSLICDALGIPYDKGDSYPVPAAIAIRHLEAVAGEAGTGKPLVKSLEQLNGGHSCLDVPSCPRRTAEASGAGPGTFAGACPDAAGSAGQEGDLTMDLSVALGAMIDLHEEEAQLRQQAMQFEQAFEARAEGRLVRALAEHEGAVTHRARIEVETCRLEAARALDEVTASADQLAVRERAALEARQADSTLQVRQEMDSYALELQAGRQDSVENHAATVRDHFELQFAECVRQVEQHAHEHCQLFAAGLRERSRGELAEAELAAATRHASDEHVSKALRLEIVSLRGQATAERDIAVSQCRLAEQTALEGARAHAGGEGRDRVLDLRSRLEAEEAQSMDLRARLRAAGDRLEHEEFEAAELRATALCMQGQVDDFVQRFTEGTQHVLETEQNIVENAEAVAEHEEFLVAQLRGASLSRAAGQPEVATSAPGALRMKSSADPFRVRSLAQGASAAEPLGGQQRAVLCGAQTFHIAPDDDDSEVESIGDKTERRRTAVKTIDLGKAPTGLGFQTWLNELYVTCCAASNRGRGETLRKMKMCRDGRLKLGNDVSGRVALWFILRKYDVEAGAMQQAKAYVWLAVDFDIFDRAAPGSPEKSVEFLYRCARTCLFRIDREAMRTSLTKSASAAPVLPKGPPVAGPCFGWIRGECKRGAACKYTHDPKAAPKQKGADAAAGKGKVKGSQGKDCMLTRGKEEPSKGDLEAQRRAADGEKHGAGGGGAGAVLGGAPKQVMLSVARPTCDDEFEEWIWDVDGKRDFSTAPPILSAGGVVRSAESVVAPMPEIAGTVEAAVLPGSPNALSAGRRCALQGYGFYWHPWLAKPEILAPDGAPIDCHADEHFVPIIWRARQRRAMLAVGGASAGHDGAAELRAGDGVPALGDGDLGPGVPGDVSVVDLARRGAGPNSDIRELLEDTTVSLTKDEVEYEDEHYCTPYLGPHSIAHQMQFGSVAYKVTPRALMLTDQETDFLGASSAKHKRSTDVVQAIYFFDDPVLVIRRLFSDRSEEFLAASKAIRSIRPFARFVSVPHRHASKAERTNRTASEGTRASLLQAGFPESWWAICMLYWVAMWNGHMKGRDGLAPYRCWHGEDAPSRMYPWGALVLVHLHKPISADDETSVAPGDDSWNLVEAKEDDDDEAGIADGDWNENAAIFEVKDTLDNVMALDGDFDDNAVKGDVGVAVDAPAVDSPAVDADRKGVLREKWRADDPVSFAAQALVMERVVALERQAPATIVVFRLSVLAAARPLWRLVQQARALIMIGIHGHMLLELCCAPDSELAAAVVGHSIAVQVAVQDDLAQRTTRRALHRLVRICQLYDIILDVWASIPCTADSPLRRASGLMDVETGREFKIGGGFTWEWSYGSDLWDLDAVQVLFRKCETAACTVSAAAVNHIIEGSEQCCGKVCTGRARYAPLFAQLVWRALRPAELKAMPAVPVRAVGQVLPLGKPRMPLWCAMVTRAVSVRSAEGQAQEAKAAAAKEIASHTERGTWDLSRVRDLSEWMKDESFAEVLVGRAFIVLGVKFSELAQTEWKCRARAVCRGNNIWSRSGKTVYEIFDEVSNSPSSLTAAGTAMAIGQLKRMSATYRDATDAFLQALLDKDPSIVDLVELPRAWRPREWYEDDAMTVPKYRRPAVPLGRALPGHPKSGNVWEDHAETILVRMRWRKIDSWNGVFVHVDMSVLCLYVDDFMMVAAIELAWVRWHELGEHILFKEEAAPLLRYLGANYRFDEYSATRPGAARSMAVSMEDSLLALVRKFLDGYPDAALHKVASPYPAEQQWSDPSEEPGKFQPHAASCVASCLFASLVGRPDLSTAMRRLTTRVARWTVPDDVALVRLLSYIQSEASQELVGTLAPSDLDGLRLEPSTDADWNGAACSTKGVNGLHLELVGEASGNEFPIAWRSSGRTATSNSTAESEVVSLSHGVRHVAMPVQDLVQEMIGVRIPLICKVDSCQAIAAVEKGYSKRLRCLHRTHRIAIGFLHEIFADEEQKCSVEYTESSKQKGNVYTKALNPAQFRTECEMIGMRR
ncbi:unnamed protein product, partial [Prorocentrum cordatum]